MSLPPDHFPREEYLDSACRRIEEWLRRGDAAGVELMEAQLLYRIVSVVKEIAKLEGNNEMRRRCGAAQQAFRKVRNLDARGESASPGIANLALMAATDPLRKVTLAEFEGLPGELEGWHSAGTLLYQLGLYGSQRGVRLTPGVQAKALSMSERGRPFESFEPTFVAIAKELSHLDATEAKENLMTLDPLVDWQSLFTS